MSTLPKATLLRCLLDRQRSRRLDHSSSHVLRESALRICPAWKAEPGRLECKVSRLHYTLIDRTPARTKLGQLPKGQLLTSEQLLSRRSKEYKLYCELRIMQEHEVIEERSKRGSQEEESRSIQETYRTAQLTSAGTEKLTDGNIKGRAWKN